MMDGLLEATLLHPAAARVIHTYAQFTRNVPGMSSSPNVPEMFRNTSLAQLFQGWHLTIEAVVELPRGKRQQACQ